MIKVDNVKEEEKFPSRSGRKFAIALGTLITISVAYLSTVGLAIADKLGPMNGTQFTGSQLMIGIGLVLGLYGASNVIDKLRGKGEAKE